MRIRVKNHQMPLTSRVDTARGATSDPDVLTNSSVQNVCSYVRREFRAVLKSEYIAAIQNCELPVQLSSVAAMCAGR